MVVLIVSALEILDVLRVVMFALVLLMFTALDMLDVLRVVMFP